MPDDIVTTQDGKLRGFIEETHNGHKFLSFMGVPYAKPPIGNLKFKAPQTVEPWHGIHDANTENNTSLSMDLQRNLISGDFDCLYLNVFTPEGRGTNEGIVKPVMVWIHGGGFTFGSKNRQFFDPEYFMDKDIVLVTINYRLGVLGFLSLEDPKLCVSGNAGLKDQVMALKWIQRNIHFFGGDANNVTLFGESAGAASVSFHILSPMSKGLFHKAIMQSGVATCPWAEGHTDFGKEMLKALGKTASNDSQMLEILENASREELIKAQQKVPDEWKPNQQRFIGPIVETSTSEEHFLSDTPQNILSSGNYNKVPVIMGCTTNEGLIMKMLSTSTNKDYSLKNDTEYVPYSLTVSEQDPVKNEDIGNKIKRFYYGDEIPDETNLQCYYNLISDVNFRLGVFNFAKDLLRTSGNNVFLYNFDAVTELNKFKVIHDLTEFKGVCHVEDVLYMFKTIMTPSVEVDSKEYIAIQRMTTWWTNFAKFSNPNGELSKEFAWPIATGKMEYLNIDVDISVGNEICTNEIYFWKAVEDEMK